MSLRRYLSCSHDGNDTAMLNCVSAFFVGQYSLTVKFNDPVKGPTAKHYRIRNLDNGGFYISTRITFDKLEQLVNYYLRKLLLFLLILFQFFHLLEIAQGFVKIALWFT